MRLECAGFGIIVLIPTALYPRQSGDTSTPLEPHLDQTMRRALAIAGNGFSGARPIASKLTGVERRQSGLQHVNQAPATSLYWTAA